MGGFKQDTIEVLYDEISGDYEKCMIAMGHPDPEECATLVEEILGKELGKVSALDFGCGTGLTGQALKKRGVGSITGIDASQGMLSKAAEKNSYDELVHMFLGKPKEFPARFRSRFDITTATAILAEGHLMSEVFDEMIHALKQGGYAIFSTREMYLDKYNYRQAIEELERRGYWKKIHQKSFKKYQNIEAGTKIGRYEAVDVMIYAYQKL